MASDTLNLLQWGRVHVNAESVNALPFRAYNLIWLQWGRVHVNAESPTVQAVVVARPAGAPASAGGRCDFADARDIAKRLSKP